MDQVKTPEGELEKRRKAYQQYDPEFLFRFDLDFWEWVVEIDWYSYWNAMYVTMIGMVLVVLNSFLGAWASLQVLCDGWALITILALAVPYRTNLSS